jgi:hypothetical protein
MQEMEREKMEKRNKCESVREGEKIVHLTVSQVRKYKREQADELKL